MFCEDLMSDLHHAIIMTNYHHYCCSYVFIVASYRATLVKLCISRGHVVEVHQQQSALDMCSTNTCVVTGSHKFINTANSKELIQK